MMEPGVPNFWHLPEGLCIRSISLLTERLPNRAHIPTTRGHVPVSGIFFLPMPPPVLMNFVGFSPGCGDSVADF